MIKGWLDRTTEIDRNVAYYGTLKSGAEMRLGYIFLPQI